MIARNEEEAVGKAAEIGYPVVLKLYSRRRSPTRPTSAA